MTTTTEEKPLFDRERHLRYFAYCLKHLPSGYDKLDTNRLTLVHFAVQSLDLLGMIPDEPHDNVCLDEQAMKKRGCVDKKAVIEWLYGLQAKSGGFLGGTFLGPCSGNDGYGFEHGHIAMTYTALCVLAALGDDLSRINRTGIIRMMQKLQRDDGSFQCVEVGSEHDMRFLYCACSIAYMLNDWSGVDTERAVAYVRACRAYDGGIALIPGQEGHGGSTFCGVASLMLMNRINVLDQDDEGNPNDWKAQLIHWCVHRQVGGMQGRPNKAQDTCYSFWIGGTLALLQNKDLLDHSCLREYVFKCQTRMGGFGKIEGVLPDVLHSFYSMAWLSISPNESIHPPLRELNCTLGFCQDRKAVFDNATDIP